jgi:hypothetical protein
LLGGILLEKENTGKEKENDLDGGGLKNVPIYIY